MPNTTCCCCSAAERELVAAGLLPVVADAEVELAPLLGLAVVEVPAAVDVPVLVPDTEEKGAYNK